MSTHLQQFASEHIAGKPSGYLLALAFVCRGVTDRGRLSEKIRVEVERLGVKLLTIDPNKRGRHYQRFLSKRLQVAEVQTGFDHTIKALRVKDFRGFGSLSAEDHGTLISFNPSKNIFYAPNGGGKTSLCESLEYVFTGSIKEAERRRTKLSEYVRRGAEKAIARVMLCDDSVFSGTIKIDTCFLDRNRLQEFSLLGSKDTKFDEADVLATLFGLEEIEDLITRFVQPRSFSLSSCKRRVVLDEAAQISIRLQNISERKTVAATSINVSKENIAKNLGLEKYQRDDVAMRLAFRKQLLSHKRKVLADLKMQELPQGLIDREFKIYIKKFLRKVDRYKSIKFNLAEQVLDSSFESLFELITQIKKTGYADCCPACLTPLCKVEMDPFDRASHELNHMGSLTRLRNGAKSLERDIFRLLGYYADLCRIVSANKERGIPVPSELLPLLLNPSSFNSTDVTDSEKLNFWQQIAIKLEKVSHVIDSYSRNCQETRERLSNVTSVYKARQDSIDKLEAELNEVSFHRRSISESRNIIKENAALLLPAIQEKLILDRKLREEQRYNQTLDDIEEQYPQLLEDLKQYKLKIESAQIAGVEDKAAEFYRLINDGDSEHERVERMNFVRSNAGYRIQLTFGSGARHDAFSCLSEGHLRSLGLALLLAVASIRKYPFIIFDDVVNAIDAEHRANIITLLLTDAYLSRIQQVITTHDRLFWERYCNAVKAKFGAEMLQSKVLTCTNRGIVIADYEGGFKRKIENSLKVYDIRQALVYCRIWFESIIAAFCADKELEVRAVFSRRQLKPNNYLEISLESTYRQIEPYVAWDSSNYDLVKKDLVNWKGQNQEHHAFDEGSLNFAHAKTSGEVEKIYRAICQVEYQLYPSEFIVELEKERTALQLRMESENKKLSNDNFLNRAPVEVIVATKERASDLQKKIALIADDLIYLNRCAEALLAHK